MIIDLTQERERRILKALEAHEPVRLKDQAVTCDCGSVRFHLLRSAEVECVKCGEKQAFMTWSIAHAL